MTTFYQLSLSDPIIKAVSNMGFEEATPIQTQTIPVAMQGLDLIGQAQTGTGKTAAFGIPMIEEAERDETAIQGVIIAPTRELAMQVAAELNRIGQYKGIRTLPIYGGQEIVRQIRALKNKPHIIVATPGRFIDHLRRRTIRLHGVKTVVLDEADEMLNMGFLDDIEKILQDMPTERQTLLFSATMPQRIQALAKKFMSNPQVIAVKSKEMTVENITQQYIEVPEKQKFDVVCRLLDIHAPELAIVFGRTKRRVDELSEALVKRGYDAEGIHGDLTQSQRDVVMRKFKGGTIEVLVATDVAARGLDISGVTHVINFDVPQDPESYVHRIGRTGRAGRTGIAITFATPREVRYLRSIEKITRSKIERRPIPTFTQAIEGQQRITVEKLIQAVEEGQFHDYRATAEELLTDTDSVTLLAAALKMLTREPNTAPVKLTAEAPLRTKQQKSGGYRGGGRSRDRNKNWKGKHRSHRKHYKGDKRNYSK